MSTVFFSYCHKDEGLRDELEAHLAMLKRQGVISTWHDRRLVAGDPLDTSISAELVRADIILLLVSSDFLASEYCYSVEMTRAIERHNAGEARVIPVILRPCDWHGTPFGGVLATPPDGKPITKWPDRDVAFLEVTKAIRAAAKTGVPSAAPPVPTVRAAAMPVEEAPRSSNLRLKKTFTQLDKDTFQEEAFEFMARFFETSLAELSTRNSGIEGRFRRIDATKFTAAVYRNGQLLGQCQIRHSGGGMGLMNGIAYAVGSMGDNAFNEMMSVDVGDQSLGMKSLGMQMLRSKADTSHLTFEGAAEYYWGLFVEPLQR